MGKESLEGIKVPASDRTYFFDVKEAKNGSPYLVVSQSKKNKEGKFERQSIMVFQDHFQEVFDAIKKVAPKFGVNN